MSLIVTEKVIIGFAIIFNAIKEGSMAVAIFRLYWSSSKQELYIKKKKENQNLKGKIYGFLSSLQNSV